MQIRYKNNAKHFTGKAIEATKIVYIHPLHFLHTPVAFFKMAGSYIQKSFSPFLNTVSIT